MDKAATQSKRNEAKARVEAFQDVKKVAQQRLEEDELDLPVKMERLGTKIVEFHKVGKSFGDKIILSDFTYNVQRNERLGIVGNNGTGKSTFLKILLGQEPADKGKRSLVKPLFLDTTVKI